MKLSKPNYLRICSDLHLDFDVSYLPSSFKFENLWFPEPMEHDNETALIIAGDIWHANKPFEFMETSWIKEISKRFQYVFIVLGNHDFWTGYLEKEYLNYRKKIASQDLKNVFLLQNSTVYFDDLKIIGATLWTDFMNSNPICMRNASTCGMKDYKHIKINENQPLTSNKILEQHITSKKYIYDNYQRDNEKQKIVVVTHHSPSYLSMPEKFDRSEMNLMMSLYHSNLDEFIAKSSVDLWIHGHSHFAVDYNINKTNILSNPRGYPHQDTGFNPWLLIDCHNLRQLNKNKI